MRQSQIAMAVIALYGLVGISQAAEGYTLPPLHHPVEITVPASMSTHPELILGSRGELVCETCHGIEDLKQIPLAEVDLDAPGFLNLGPYRDLTDFCYHCHEEKDHQRYNLHLMLNEQGDMDDRGCIYCHMETPDPSVDEQMSEMEFRLPKEKLCYGCHLKTPHLNALNHQTEPSEEIRKVMRRAEKEHGVKLPLDDEGKIACITCHSPHQSGVIDPGTAAGKVVQDQPVEEGIAYSRTAWSHVFAKDKRQRLQELKLRQLTKAELPEYLRVEKEILLRLSAKNGTLCQACHEFED